MMAEHEQEGFLPEEVDEQIDDYLALSQMSGQAQDISAQDLLQALQQHFTLAENEDVLKRVWQRFEQQQVTDRSYQRIQQAGTIQAKRRYQMKQSSRKEHGSFPTQGLGMLAAVILTVLLVGSMVLVFQLALHGKTQSNNQGGASASKDEKMFALVDNTLYRLDTQTHQPLWHFTVPAGANGHLGTIAQRGEVLGNTYYLLGMDPRIHLYALDIASGTIRWQLPLSDNMLASPVLAGNSVYVYVVKEGYLTVEALDATTGKIKWDHRLAEKITNNTGTGNTGTKNTDVEGMKQISVTEGMKQISMKLITASSDAVYGEFLSVENGKNSAQRFALSAQDGHELWLKSEDPATWFNINQGFLVNGVLCVVGENGDSPINAHAILSGYSAASGELLWNKQLAGRGVRDGAQVLNGIVYLSVAGPKQDQTNTTYAFSTQDGAQIWQYHDTDTTGSSYPRVTAHGIYFDRYTGQTLVALDTMSGKVRWTYTFKDNLTVEYPPEADNNYVYLSLPGNIVQMLRVSDGKEIGSFKVDAKVDPNNRVLLQIFE